MKKFDTFKTLAQGVKSFVAMLVITLMAVGNVFAQYAGVGTFEKISTLSELTTGYYVIANQGDQFAMLNTAGNYINKTDLVLTNPDNSIVWKIDVAGNGEVTIYNEAADAYVAYYGSSNNGYLISTLNDSARWTVSLDANSNWVFKNKLATERQLSYNASSPRFACYKNNNQEELSLFKLSAAAAVAAPAFTPSAGTYYVPQTVTITTETAGANIYYTIDGTTPDVTSTLYTGAFTVSATTTVKAIAISGTEESAVKTAVYNFPTIVELANIAAFKAQNSTTDVYKINSDMTVVYQTADKYHTFVQDTTGGLYIYGTLANAYNSGDVISGGLYGNYALYNQLSELKPISGTPLAAGVAGTAVEPVTVTLAELQNNYAAYEGKLVTIEGITFNANKVFTTNSTSGVAISQDTITSGFQIYNTFKQLNLAVNQGATANVTGLVIRYNQIIEIVPRQNADIQITSAATLPMNVTFEETSADSYGWVLENGTALNQWYIGKAQGFDNNKLFVSCSNGATNKYQPTDPNQTNVKAYRDIIIPATGATLSFDYRVYGQVSGTSYYDYLQVDIIKDGAATLVGKFAGSNDWKNFVYDIPSDFAGAARLQFTWINNATAGTQFPAAVDNIVLTPVTCTPPVAMTATVNATSALISWEPEAGQTNFTFEYKLANHSEWYTINTTDTFVNLTNLQGNSAYNIRVRTNCGDNHSVWIEGAFNVECQSITVEPNVTKTAGTGTSTNYYFGPATYHFYSWNQTIYPASVINSQSGNIKSIAWNVSTAGSHTIDSLKIYLGTTTATSWASTSDWLPMDQLTLVYEGFGITCAASTGWETYTLQTPYYYDNSKSLVVVVSKGSGTRSTSAKYYYTNTSNSIIYRGATSKTAANALYANHPGTATGTKSSYRGNIQLKIDELICGDVEACTQPTGLTVSNVSFNGAEVKWQSADTVNNNYILQYKQADAAAWTEVNVTGTTYTISGLNQNTEYTVRVMRNCGTNNYSEPTAAANFTTTTICPVVTNIENTNVSNTTTLSWTPGGNETEWLVQLKPTAASESEWINLNVSIIPSTTFGGLLGSTPYTVRIKSICDATDENNQSVWATYNFTTGCAAIDVPYKQLFTNNNAMPACWDHQGFDFTSNMNASATTANAYLMSPAINIPTTNTTYLCYDVTTTGSYSVMASIRGTSLDRFVELRTSDADGHVVIDLPASYKGKIAYFVFINNSGSLTVDNFNVTQCPYIISDIASTTITDNSIGLTWHCDGAAGAYQVQYGPRPNANSHMAIDAATSTTVDVYDTTAVITGLTNGQAYDFYVRANCDYDKGDWAGPFVRTAENMLVMGVDASATTCNALLHSNGYSVNGIVNYSNDANDTIVLYPATPNSLIQLRGTYATESNYDFITIYDGVGTEGTQLAKLSGSIYTSSVIETSKSGPLTVVFTSDVSTNYWGFAFYVECVPAPACTNPENVTFNVETNTLEWTNGIWGTPQSYNIKYFVVGETDTLTATATTNSAVITGLRNEVPYVFMVQSACDTNAMSGWTASDQYVRQACAVPTELAYSVDGNDIIITWEAFSTQHNFVVEYKKGEARNWTVANVNTTSYTIANASELTSYVVRVKAVCAGGDESHYTDEINVIVPCSTGITATIGDGTTNSYYAPYNNYYKNSWNESIYTAAEVGSAGSISTVSYEVGVASSLTLSELKIYMGTRNTATFASTTDWTNPGNLQLVYEGTNVVIGATEGWETINLTNPYYYNGTDNLVVVVAKKASSYNNTLKYNYTSTTGKNMYRQNDSVLSYAEQPGTNTGSTSSYFPNVKFGICPSVVPSCLSVSNIAATATGSNVTVTWTVKGTETAWDVIYTLNGETVTVTTTTPSITINGLSSATTYSIPVKVIAKCSAEDEVSSSTVLNFTTPCDAQTLPYSENFDNYTGTTSQSTMVMPVCWNRMYTGTSTSYGAGIYNSSSYASSGTNSLRLYNYKTTSTTASYGDVYAIMPEMNANINTLMMSFDARKYNSTSTTYYSVVEIGVMTDPTDASTFNLVQRVVTTTTTPTHHIIAFNNYTGPNGRFAFRELKTTAPDGYTSATGSNYTFIDNLVVEVIPSCMQPTNITVGTTTENTAEVSWTAGNNETEWQVSYTLNDVPVTANVTTPSYTITGLNPSSLYEFDFGVKAICSMTDESNVTTATISFETACAPMTLPFSEDFDAYYTSNTQATMSMPTCWERLYTGTSTSYGMGIYNSATYSTSGDQALRLYNYYTTATSAGYGDGYAIMPELVGNISNMMVTFDVKTTTSTGSTYYTNFELGVVTNPADPTNSFVTVQNISMPGGSSPAHYEIPMAAFTGTTGKIAFRMAMSADNPYATSTMTYGYNSAFVDNVQVIIAPTCFAPKNLTVTDVTSGSASLTWEDSYAQAGYAVEYREEGTTTWNTVSASTTSCTISGLNANSVYEIRVKAVCGAGDESEYTSIAKAITPCESGRFVTIGDVNSTGTTYQSPVSNYYKYSYSQQIFTAAEINANGDISSIAFQYAAASPMSKKTNVKIYMANTDQETFAGTTVNDWITEGLVLVYEGDLNCATGWNTFAFNTPFAYTGGNVVLAVEDLSNQFDGTSYTFTTTTTSGQYRALFYYNDTNPFNTTSAPNSRTTARNNVKFTVCPNPTDLAISDVKAYPYSCDITEPVVVTVLNNGYLTPVSTFEAYYKVNEGATVHETVTVPTPLAFLDEYTYTFATMPTFETGDNVITAWVEQTGDMNLLNNQKASDVIVKLAPATVPYIENFTSVVVNKGWSVIDANNDDVTFAVTSGAVAYTYNDAVAADDWMISPCIHLTPGNYNVSYDYKANSVLTETFSVYYGAAANVANMTNLIVAESFNNTTVQTNTTMITVTTEGDYNFGIHATSGAGNLGFTVDNFKVLPVVNVTVTAAANGTVTPMGVNPVNYGENFSISIIPDAMYHVAGIYVDGEQVVNEDPYSSSFMLYTLENITEPHTIFVDFKLEFHIIKTAVNARPDLYTVNGGTFVPAATDTLIDPSAFTVNMLADEHYHLNKLELGIGSNDNPIDVTADVVYNGNRSYSYTIDTLVVSNYYLTATYKIDTINVHYNILTGKGYVDASPMLTAPAQYDTWIDYSADHVMNIVPANDYYLVDVNGAGPVANDTLKNVTTTADVNVKFGFKVTANVQNYYAENLGSNEIRGTIAPTTALVAEGDAHTISGTFQEHFHLESFLIDGVENIQNVTIGDHVFSYTFAEVHGNYNVLAIIKIDTFCIQFNVAGGLVTVDGQTTTVDPQTVYTCNKYGDSWLTTHAPVPGYEITNIFVDGAEWGNHDNYMFSFIDANHVIDITAAPKDIVITTNGYGNGTVSPGTSFAFDPSVTYTFSAVPAAGHHIQSIIHNNVNVPVANPEAGYAETLTNIFENQDYVVYFAANNFTVTATANNGGIVTPTGATSYPYDATPTYTITPNAGYHIADVLVNGVSVGAVTTYTFAALDADQTIQVVFANNVYTIAVATDMQHGTITGPAASYSYGATPTYTITPDLGYVISDVLVDGLSVGAVTTYTFAPIAANHTINAIFVPETFTITATAGNGGAITPAGVITVNYGANQAYTITPATGYHIENVFVDNVSVGTAATYTFSNVTANHIIAVSFDADEYTVTVNQPAHGAITPGTQTVAYGATPTFTVTPNVGYTVGSITYNGNNVMANATQTGDAYIYTVPAVTANATLTANMVAKTYTINATAGNGGTITPAGNTTVNYGATQAYTITPNAGYIIDAVTVDGMNMGAPAAYTFVNVTANHNINVTFKVAPCDVPSNMYTLNITTNSATLTWYHAGAPSYDVRYKEVGAQTFSTATVTTNVYDITNLQPNTAYVWQVRANCTATNSSDWSNALSFRTKSEAPVDPTGVQEFTQDQVRVYASLNNVYIANENNVRINKVQIYDVYGKLIYTGNVNSNPEIISMNVATGSYVVRLNTEYGNFNYKVFLTK